MLEDHKRTGAYYNAVIANKRMFADRVVLDVGTGSGILSIFAAMAGARKVYAVEATSMAQQARKLVDANKVCACASMQRQCDDEPPTLCLENVGVCVPQLCMCMSAPAALPACLPAPAALPACLPACPFSRLQPPQTPLPYPSLACLQFGSVIEVIQGTIESIELPEKVDIIISEWMGYFLLRESMLDSGVCCAAYAVYCSNPVHHSCRRRRARRHVI